MLDLLDHSRLYELVALVDDLELGLGVIASWWMEDGLLGVQLDHHRWLHTSVAGDLLHVVCHDGLSVSACNRHEFLEVFVTEVLQTVMNQFGLLICPVLGGVQLGRNSVRQVGKDSMGKLFRKMGR